MSHHMLGGVGGGCLSLANVLLPSAGGRCSEAASPSSHYHRAILWLCFFFPLTLILTLKKKKTISSDSHLETLSMLSSQ